MQNATLAYRGPRSLWAAATALAAVCAAGCATLSPPVSVSAATDRSNAPRTTSSSELELDPVEGRPGALVLRLKSSFEPPPESRLEVRRRVGRGSAQTIRTVELSSDLSTQLAEKGVEFIDRSVEPGPPLRYRLLYFESAEADTPDARSAILTVDWKEPPPRPKDVRAHADTSRAVELRWKPPNFGALVFRRNVLKREAATRRIATVGPSMNGTFVDRDVVPGAVYTYRVALSIEHEEFTQYGPPSEPLYVSVPAK